MSFFDSMRNAFGMFDSGDTSISEEGVVSKIDTLDLKMEDDELLKLGQNWEEEGKKVTEEIKGFRELNQRYYKGDHDVTTDVNPRPSVDNVIFESVEILKSTATKLNPGPVVVCDDEMLGRRIEKTLASIATETALRLKMKKAVDHWLKARIGVLKVSYSYIEDAIDVSAPRPLDLIIDPKAVIDERGIYYGRFLGQKREDTAETLKRRFKNASKEIDKESKGKDQSLISYTEWWTDDKLFYKMKDVVLGKFKNPHWNWPETETKTMPDGTVQSGPRQITELDASGEPVMDDQGLPVMQDIPDPQNFLAHPSIPYVFISIFTSNDHPYDDTSLIEQAIPMQDQVNKRVSQIDRNCDNMNGSILYNGRHFTKDTATKADIAIRRGKGVHIPLNEDETLGDAIVRTQGLALPNNIPDSLMDCRTRVRDIIGVRGSSPQGLAGEQTVRGKIIASSKDDSRTGGGITDFLEQVSESVFKMFMQFIAVYYDTPHAALRAGKMEDGSYPKLESKDILGVSIQVSVKEGSLIPEDPMTKRNEAIDLMNAKMIDPISLFEKLGDPNPKKRALDLMIYQLNPTAYLPELQQYLPQPEPLMDPNAVQQPPAPQPQPSGNLLNEVPLQ